MSTTQPTKCPLDFSVPPVLGMEAGGGLLTKATGTHPHGWDATTCCPLKLKQNKNKQIKRQKPKHSCSGASAPPPCLCLPALSPNLLDIYRWFPPKSFLTAGLLTLHHGHRLRGVTVLFSLQKKEPRRKNPPGSCPVLNSGVMDDYGPSALSQGDGFMSRRDS